MKKVRTADFAADVRTQSFPNNSRAVVPEVGQTAPSEAVGLPLLARCSLIYDSSDLRAVTGKLASLHQAHPSH
jgi:hypothetical protein